MKKVDYRAVKSAQILFCMGSSLSFAPVLKGIKVQKLLKSTKRGGQDLTDMGGVSWVSTC